MADPLSAEQAKAALSGVAHGKPRSFSKPTIRDAKANLRRMARMPTLLSLTRTMPFLAFFIALGYGFILGSSRAPQGKFVDFLARLLTRQ